MDVLQSHVLPQFWVDWTNLLMTLPVIAALVTLLISLRYQRKVSRDRIRMEWPKGKRLHLHTHKFVTAIDGDEAWEIDGPVANQPPFMNFAPSFDDFFHGQLVPIRRSSYDMEMTDVHEVVKNLRTVLSLKSTNEKAPMRLPWNEDPTVPATSRLRVDGVKSNCTSSSEAVGRNEINVPVAWELAEDVDRVLPKIDKTRSLTTSEPVGRDSQEVILISKIIEVLPWN